MTHPLMSACILVGFVLFSSFSAAAQDRPEHYKGKSSASFEEALKNLKQYNSNLAAMVNTQKTLSATDLASIHQLTYTLENALEKMVLDIQVIQDSLEKLHKSSEGSEPKKVKELGEKYLELSTPLTQYP